MSDIVSHVNIYGFDESVRRAKFPMSTDTSKVSYELTEGIKKLAQSHKGEGHDQWLTGIIVQFDLTFSNKAWVEMERYHFIDFVSSQSTMHRITKFELSKAYNEYVDPRIIEIMQELVDQYNEKVDPRFMSGGALEAYEQSKRDLYLKILYSNPAGFKLTAGITTNYRQLKTI